MTICHEPFLDEEIEEFFHWQISLAKVKCVYEVLQMFESA